MAMVAGCLEESGRTSSVKGNARPTPSQASSGKRPACARPSADRGFKGAVAAKFGAISSLFVKAFIFLQVSDLNMILAVGCIAVGWQ
mmetsp:Transcript_26961/g.48736  ORF Transcript_26961/g.48736 Transcript_26961/m.48736 type:complete len:87 (-) Transcript_26961:146-406(-)